jgi:hypothetical protein
MNMKAMWNIEWKQEGTEKKYFQGINWNPKFINAVRRHDKGLVTLQRTGRTRISRKELEFKFKGSRFMGWPKTRWSSQILDIRRSGKSWQEICVIFLLC